MSSSQTASDRSAVPVELTINGQRVHGRPGQTILQVVQEHRLDEIPTLCHDPKLEPYGSCFLCVVEVKGLPRLVPACVTPIRDGMEVTTRSERIRHARRTALELLLSDHYADCVCPGQIACPAGVDVQGYLSLARLGHYEGALALIRERNPLPVVCGRVCVRKCEVQCRRNEVDEPVGINFVKRYVSEQAEAHPVRPPNIAPTGKRVAIVGGGPAGLTCANYLALRGHAVTILEAQPKLGGMLRYGIPSYRLPREELDHEIQQILDLGVEVLPGKRLGRDFTLDNLIRQQGFDAVFLAVGAPLGKKLGIPGEENVAGLQSALDFLGRVEFEGPPRLSGKVAVVGGGNSAIDAARTALRCGADEVTILYRRTRKEMPAHHEEVDAAEKEGVRLELLVAPLAVLAEDGRLRGIRCIRMELGEPDASGRRRPIPIPGSEFEYTCDYLFAAIGQDTDPSMMGGEPEGMRPKFTRGATLAVDSGTLATNITGVFGGGDVVHGPSVVIDAVAHGRQAAEVIDHYLRTGEVRAVKPPFVSKRDAFGALPKWVFDGVPHTARTPMPERDGTERRQDFAQVELGLSEAQTQAEAFRCMECGCKAVFRCDLKRLADEYSVEVSRYAGSVRQHRVDASHPLITLDPNKCILCGRCVRVCADVVSLSVLGFVGRGFKTVVAPALGRPLRDSTCIACGECVETCPTGALEARLPYARQGPWRSKSAPSICTFCSLGCRLDVQVVADGLLWANSPQNGDGTLGELCLKGRFGTGVIQGFDRLRRPLVRREGRLIETDWDEAIAQASTLLRACVDRHGSDGVGVLVAPRITLEECYLVKHVAQAALRTRQVGSIGQHLRHGPRSDLDDILGETASTCVQEDIATADLMFLVGADPSSTHPVLAMAIRRAARRGAEVAAVNSSGIDLVRGNGLWLDARRGTAGIILAWMIRRIIESGRADRRIAARDERALLALFASVRDLDLEEVAAISGVEASKIEGMLDRLASSRRIVTIYDLDETLERSTDDLAALTQLLLFTGHLGKDGEGLLLLRSDCNSEGARLVGIAEPLALERIRGALVMFEDPLGDRRARREVGAVEPLVVVDHFMTETARAAQVVLPASALVESEGTVVSFDRRVRAIRPACRPMAGLSTADVLARLAESLGSPIASGDPAWIRAEIATGLGISSSELEAVRREAGIWPLPRDRQEAIRLRAVHVDSTPWMADVSVTTSLDAYLDRRLRDLGLILA